MYVYTLIYTVSTNNNPRKPFKLLGQTLADGCASVNVSWMRAKIQNNYDNTISTTLKANNINCKCWGVCKSTRRRNKKLFGKSLNVENLSQ